MSVKSCVYNTFAQHWTRLLPTGYVTSVCTSLAELSNATNVTNVSICMTNLLCPSLKSSFSLVPQQWTELIFHLKHIRSEWAAGCESRLRLWAVHSAGSCPKTAWLEHKPPDSSIRLLITGLSTVPEKKLSLYPH